MLKKPEMDYKDDTIGFGYGRRICPGKDFANNELDIAISRLLWAFDCCKAVDEKRTEITSSADGFCDENILIS